MRFIVVDPFLVKMAYSVWRTMRIHFVPLRVPTFQTISSRDSNRRDLLDPVARRGCIDDARDEIRVGDAQQSRHDDEVA